MNRRGMSNMFKRAMMSFLVLALSMTIVGGVSAEGKLEYDYVAEWMFDYGQYSSENVDGRMTKAKDGTIYSFAQSKQGEDTFLFAISSEGRLLWKTKIPVAKVAANKNLAKVDKITVLKDGTIVTVTGFQNMDYVTEGVLVNAFTPDGKWKWKYVPKDKHNSRLVAMPDGNLYILPAAYTSWPNTWTLLFGPVPEGAVYGLNSAGKVILNKTYKNFSELVVLEDGTQVIFQKHDTKLVATVFKKGKKTMQHDLGDAMIESTGVNNKNEVFVHYYTVSGKGYDILGKLGPEGKWLWKKSVGEARFFSAIDFSIEGHIDAIDASGRTIRFDRNTGKAAKFKAGAKSEDTFLTIDGERISLGEYYYTSEQQLQASKLMFVKYKDKQYLVLMKRAPDQDS